MHTPNLIQQTDVYARPEAQAIFKSFTFNFQIAPKAMKQLFLTLLLAAVACVTAFAGAHPSKEALDAAIKESRKEYVRRESALQSALQSPNSIAAKTAVADVLNIMQSGMRMTQQNILNVTGENQLKAINHYDQMESIFHKYNMMSRDVPANAKQLAEQAAAFAKIY